MIKGELVGLRAIEEADLEFLRDWRNLAGFRRNFREVRELNMDDQKRWFKSIQDQRHSNFMFTIIRVSDNQPVGACGLLYINWIIRSADYSFYIGMDELYIDQQGMAKEATDLLLNYGFSNLNLNKIWMELYEFDHKKIDFFTQLFNFKKDGKLRQNCFEGGRYWDSFIISLLREDYVTPK